MCLIIHRPKGRVIPPHFLTNAAHRNSDGWGLMWADRGRLTTVRDLDMDALATAVAEAPDVPLTVHLRFGTHGTNNLANCHPFSFAGGKYALMHNGVIPGQRSDPTRSDTYHFAEYVLEPLLLAAPKLFDSAGFAEALAQMVGAANKLVLLRGDGKQVIVNRDQGVDRSGLWLSNAYSVEPIPTLFNTLGTEVNWYSKRYTLWTGEERNRKGTAPLTDREWTGSAFRDDEYRITPDLVEETRDILPAPEVPYDIWDCMDLERDDLIDACRTDPETMADIIQDALWQLQAAFKD